MAQTTIAPGLLLAMPQLDDPNFQRSVVLMVEHSEEGSFGLIVNRPANVRVAQLLEAIQLEWSGDPEALVGFGGPVMTGSGWLLHPPGTLGELDESSLRVTGGIALSTSDEAWNRFAERPPERFLVLVGYAGWGPGQLGAEMLQGSWLHAEATPELLFGTPPERQWEAALASIGVDPSMVTPAGGLH